MAGNRIQNLIDAIIAPFERNTPLETCRSMLAETRTVVQAFYRNALDGADPVAAATQNPDAIHQITKENFGFKIFEQPDYGQVDDYAWEFSQRYTTLENVTLPSGSKFFTSKREPVSRTEMLQKMASGDYHLFDIALSDEYVLLGANEKFSVKDLEQRFSTNNEHLPPQSGSATDGRVKVFRSDPRAIIISYSNTNSDRGHLQVVFEDEQGRPRESVALTYRAGEEPELTRQTLGVNERGTRYPITIDDAPYYAYALALTHFAGGFSNDFKRNWFDERQAQEVVKMLNKLADNGLENNSEPVIRDALGDGKVLKGNINPTILVPEIFAAALQSEIDHKKLRALPAEDRGEDAPGFAQRYAARNAQSRGLG